MPGKNAVCIFAANGQARLRKMRCALRHVFLRSAEINGQHYAEFGDAYRPEDSIIDAIVRETYGRLLIRRNAGKARLPVTIQFLVIFLCCPEKLRGWEIPVFRFRERRGFFVLTFRDSFIKSFRGLFCLRFQPVSGERRYQSNQKLREEKNQRCCKCFCFHPFFFPFLQRSRRVSRTTTHIRTMVSARITP